MARFASKTKVPVARSKAEIEKLVLKNNASKFMCGGDGKVAVVVFEMHDRRVCFRLPLPDLTKAGGDQEERRRFRALTLCIKAKLQAVEDGITSFEEEFLAHIMLPNGKTVGEWMQPQIETTYHSKKMPQMLIGLDSN